MIAGFVPDAAGFQYEFPPAMRTCNRATPNRDQRIAVLHECVVKVSRQRTGLDDVGIVQKVLVRDHGSGRWLAGKRQVSFEMMRRRLGIGSRRISGKIHAAAVFARHDAVEVERLACVGWLRECKQNYCKTAHTRQP